MRTWVYSWKSSDGLRHEGEIQAKTKDDAYDALRERGIRAIRVTERIQPVVRSGFSGLRKRDWAVAFLAVLLALGGVYWLLSRAAHSTQSTKPNGGGGSPAITSGIVQVATPRPRHWLALPAGIDLSSVFHRRHEAYLAGFAIPGERIGGFAMDADVVQDFYDNLNCAILIGEDDDASVAELKRIVSGMKEDAKRYLTMPAGLENLRLRA